ncbi:MAG: glycosyltransferase [Candidatus Bathyarchaeia archaeon]
MPEVMIFLPDLKIGGAERAVVNLLNNWPTQERDRLIPTLVLRRFTGELRGQIPKWIEVVSLGLPSSGLYSAIATPWKLASLMRRRRPSVIIAFHTATFAWVVLASRLGSPKTKILVSVNSPPSRVFGAKHRKLLFASASNLTDFFLAATQGIAEEIHSLFGIPAKRIAVLPPSVDSNAIIANRSMPVNHPAFTQSHVPVIIASGRLNRTKRYDILLQAASVLSARIKFNLVILGEGPLRSELEQLTSKLGITDRTFFLGSVSNPWPYISKASLLVLSSDYEGFGLVLIEAMVCGVPVVSTRAPYGPESIITNEVSGLLVPIRDPEALANGMLRLLVDQELRQRCIEGGLQRASEFRVQRVMQSLDLVLEEITRDGP